MVRRKHIYPPYEIRVKHPCKRTHIGEFGCVAGPAIHGSLECALFQLLLCPKRHFVRRAFQVIYRFHDLVVRIRLWESNAVYLTLGDDAMARQKVYRGLMSELVDLDVIAKIRHCANTGLVLGTEKFRKQVAVMVE